VQKFFGKVLGSIFLGSRRHPPIGLSCKEPSYQSGILLLSAGAIEAPCHRAIATHKKLAYLGFQYLYLPT